MLAISLILIVRRAVLAILFEKRRRQSRLSDRTIKHMPLGWRTVDIYTSRQFEGTPFTGGIFRPYICIPEETFNTLTEPERMAVIEHELGHVKQWDLLGTLLIKVLGDLLWFIPGYRILSRKIDSLREVLADRSATKAGVPAEQLASALLRLKDMQAGDSEAVLYSAFFRDRKTLKSRVEILTGRAPVSPGRLGWNRPIGKMVITAWTAGAVMLATFGGNHEVSVQLIPAWFEALLKTMGLI